MRYSCVIAFRASKHSSATPYGAAAARCAFTAAQGHQRAGRRCAQASIPTGIAPKILVTTGPGSLGGVSRCRILADATAATSVGAGIGRCTRVLQAQRVKQRARMIREAGSPGKGHAAWGPKDCPAAATCGRTIPMSTRSARFVSPSQSAEAPSSHECSVYADRVPAPRLPTAWRGRTRSLPANGAAGKAATRLRRRSGR